MHFFYKRRPLNILIVKTSSMGDVVHALPVLADIRKNIRGVRIDWLVEEPFADIVRHTPLVDETIICNVRKWRRSIFSKQTREEIQALKKRLQEKKYDRVIDLQGLIKSAAVGKLAKSPIAGYDRASIKEPVASWMYDKTYPVSKKLSAVERCRQLTAQALDYVLPDTAPVFDFLFSSEKVENKQAIFFVNTSRKTKLWPENYWIELGRLLTDEGWKVFFAWASPEEKERVEKIKNAIGQDAFVLARMKIGELMKFTATCELVVGVDTGMTHLGSAMGLPTVGIFRDYPIELVPLMGEGKKCALGGVDACPEVKEVYDAVKEVLS